MMTKTALPEHSAAASWERKTFIQDPCVTDCGLSVTCRGWSMQVWQPELRPDLTTAGGFEIPPSSRIRAM
jgi:hypothetical protein